MSELWKRHAEGAMVDLTAALTVDQKGSLSHLRDALANIERAIEELEGDE